MIPWLATEDGAGNARIYAALGPFFSHVDVEERIPATHLLRTTSSLDAEFAALYQHTGRQSIAPERLLRASLLQAFYSARSNSLLSCSLSRTQTRNLVSGFAERKTIRTQARTAGGRD